MTPEELLEKRKKFHRCGKYLSISGVIFWCCVWFLLPSQTTISGAHWAFAATYVSGMTFGFCLGSYVTLFRSIIKNS